MLIDTAHNMACDDRESDGVGTAAISSGNRDSCGAATVVIAEKLLYCWDCVLGDRVVISDGPFRIALRMAY